jgi:hypothetical protein
MLNSNWLYAPFILQMLCMAADEFWFHRRRGLPRWERLGHPLDTLTVAACLVWVLCTRPTSRTVVAFVFLAIFSCLFVTKDEPVHRRYCSAGEQWLHAVLFMLHPVVLASAAVLWPGPAAGTVQSSGFQRSFLELSLTLMLSFGAYQLVYWNLLWNPKKAFR